MGQRGSSPRTRGGRSGSGEGSAAGLAAAQRRRLTGARGEGAAEVAPALDLLKKAWGRAANEKRGSIEPESHRRRGIRVAEGLPGVRSWVKSGRCSGRGCGWRLREHSWRRDGTATGAWADGGSAVQRRRGGAGSSAPAERVKAAARVEGRRRVGGWVQGSRGGANKGQAGDLGDACLAEPRRRSRRFPLSARGMREEEGDADG